MVQKRVSRPKSVYSKDCISGSQYRSTLRFWLEATQSLKSLNQRCFRFKAEGNYFQHLTPWSTRRAEKMAKMPISGHIYPWDTKCGSNMANSQIEGPMVSVHQHTSYASSPPLDPKSIVHAYGHTWERQKWRAYSQGNIIYNSRPAGKLYTIIFMVFKFHTALV